MTNSPLSIPGEPVSSPLSRRSLLRSGTALGISSAAVVGLGGVPAAAQVGTSSPVSPPGPPSTQKVRPGSLVLNYLPSQPTGWSPTTMAAQPGTCSVGVTIGGHTTSVDFPFGDKSYRVGLMSFGRPAGVLDPIYEDVPTDPDIKYQQTLADAFGSYYSFNYLGGFVGGGEFSVESYSAFFNPPSSHAPMVNYGANLYFAFRPHARTPQNGPPMQFIQVVNWVNFPGRIVDNSDRANPFYIWGGTTSVNGTQLVNFNDSPQVMGEGGAGQALTDVFMAETFMVRDTGTKDRAGRGVIDVFGGIKYGWQVTAL
ncbi:MAG: hypothetical protein HOV67_14570 [Kribbellaceae bacterium]|nr:hypothetical protein [Kribbellaceae bacterium]